MLAILFVSYIAPVLINVPTALCFGASTVMGRYGIPSMIFMVLGILLIPGLGVVVPGPDHLSVAGFIMKWLDVGEIPENGYVTAICVGICFFPARWLADNFR